MTSDHRITSGFITDMLDVLDRHGYARGDDQHASRAIGLIGDLARIWEGTQDHPAGAHPITVSSSLPAHPGPGSQTARYEVVLTDGDVKTVMIALDIAADHARDRVELCADCPGQSCPTCQHRLRDAQAYDRLAAQMDRAADASAARRGQPEPGSRILPPRQADPAAGLEAGQ
jgi:hypothetical protein